MSRRSRALRREWHRSCRVAGRCPPPGVIGVTRRQRKAVANDAARHGNGRGDYMRAVGGQGELRLRLWEVRRKWREEQRRMVRRCKREMLGLPDDGERRNK